ncbi:MAG: hypothetical protein SVV80_12385 [Planctomycetota bacterium]|nr:hypothetical protein [Planctomycetota bacterium]
MDTDKAAEELKVIRRLMERPIRYSTMSGLSGVLAGCAALAGLALDRYFWNRYDPETSMWINMGVWMGVFLVALAGVLVLTRLRELKQSMPFWSSVKKRIALTILPPFVAGVGLTLAIMYHWYCSIGPNQWGLIPAIWMLFYGVALWQLGEFSPREVRFLGAAFIIAGLIAGAFFQYNIPGATTPLEEYAGFTLGFREGTVPYFTLGVTFGGFHIIYGIIVWVRHGG